MYDKLELEIAFNFNAVTQLTVISEESGHLSGYVDPLLYDFPLNESFVQIDDKREVLSIKAQKWGTITSGLSGVAVGFFPDGNGYNQWPHIRIKASPAKILQGHNVFGPECFKQSFIQMLANLEMAFPKIYSDIDIENAVVKYIDSTYSALIPDHHWPRVISVVENLPHAKAKINSAYTHLGYIQIGAGSEYQRQKLYSKMEDVLAEAKDAKKKRDHHRYKVLTDKKLLDFTRNRRRFEATTGHRKFEQLGIPTKIKEFIKYCDWHKDCHGEPLCRYLWRIAFKKILDQFEGHSMKNVNDSEIKLKIDSVHIKVKDNGKICRRRANAIFNTYKDIKREGYRTLSAIDNKTFFRNVNFLLECGISKAFLKSLDPHKPFENVISLVEVIRIDFDNQRPDWYEEPKAGYTQPGRMIKGHNQPHLKIVA